MKCFAWNLWCLGSEAVARCSVKKVFLEISQNSQENTCARVSEACNFIKKETLAQVFSCEFCEISKNPFSYRTLTVAASVGFWLVSFVRETNHIIGKSNLVYIIAAPMSRLQLQKIIIKTAQKQPSRGTLGKGVLKICSKFAEEHSCRRVVSIKLLYSFIEIAIKHGCSSVNLLSISRTPFPEKTDGWLLLTASWLYFRVI